MGRVQKRGCFADKHSDEPMIKNRVLLSAIIFSAVWHLFWLSALTVTVVPKDTKPPQFSSVSFLGPILDQSISVVSSAIGERSREEKRYLNEIGRVSEVINDKTTYAGTDSGGAPDLFDSDEIFSGLAVSAIDGDKIEPGNAQ